MKKILLSVLMLSSSILLNAQQSLNTNEYEKFIKEQETPLTKTDDEIYLLDGIAWIRLNGEKEYVLSPTVENISDYKNRINEANQPELGIFKSTMSFINVPVNSTSKALLKQMSIIVPNYVVDNVNVYLPLIDIEKLTENGISIKMLDEYGKKPQKKVTDVEAKNTLIWSEDWEASTLPSALYSSAIGSGASNCGWQDVSCHKHGGDWSVWCSSAGTSCNACGNNYVNNMLAEFFTASYINISNYTNVVFSYWIDVEFNSTGTNDILQRWTNLGSGWALNVTFNSASPINGELWVELSSTLSGNPSQYAFSFLFESNAVGTNYGAYIDDLELRGNPVSVGLDEIYNNPIEIEIYPNPNDGIFTLELKNTMESDIDVEIFDVVGKNIHSESINMNNVNKATEIDLSNLSTGVYTVVVLSKNSKISKKLIIE